MNAYDTEHAVTARAKMSKSDWGDAYHMARSVFYTPEHCEIVLRCAAALNIDRADIADALLYFSEFVKLEQVHPLQGGMFRFKYRSDRRPGRSIEPMGRSICNTALRSPPRSCRRRWRCTGSGGCERPSKPIPIAGPIATVP